MTDMTGMIAVSGIVDITGLNGTRKSAAYGGLLLALRV